MAAFVLVHGGWHGGWCWRSVVSLLRRAGHEVYAPTLSGLGERAHLQEALRERLGLETHVRDVAGLLEYEDLRDVVLVGHSYGGMVIGAAADRVPERVAGLAYVDAFVPEDGQALFDRLRAERREMYEQQARERGEGWRVPPPSPEALGVGDDELAAWVAARLAPQPLRTFTEPIRLSGDPTAGRACTYVHCTQGPIAPSFAPFASRLRDAPGWRYAELATGHDAMVTMPGELASLLLQVGF